MFETTGEVESTIIYYINLISKVNSSLHLPATIGVDIEGGLRLERIGKGSESIVSRILYNGVQTEYVAKSVNPWGSLHNFKTCYFQESERIRTFLGFCNEALKDSGIKLLNYKYATNSVGIASFVQGRTPCIDEIEKRLYLLESFYIEFIVNLPEELKPLWQNQSLDTRGLYGVQLANFIIDKEDILHFIDPFAISYDEEI